MAIRFPCPRCRQLLGIASRKVGTEIECPRCGFLQKVPSKEAAAAAMAMARHLGVTAGGRSGADVVWYDQVADSAAGQPAWAPPQPVAPGAAGTPSGATEIAGVPSGMILYRRSTLYVHGVLFAALAAGAFIAGYYVGRGSPPPGTKAEGTPAAKERILLEGKIIYRPPSGEIAGDEGAVVIALPDGKFPEKSLPVQGLRTYEQPPAANDESVRAIEQLGGGYGRADASGSFAIVLPDQGKYRVLIISKHVARSKDSSIDQLDQDQLGKYFGRVEALIGQQKYVWLAREMRPGVQPMRQEFGPDRDVIPLDLR